jgi:hypothetical protein
MIAFLTIAFALLFMRSLYSEAYINLTSLGSAFEKGMTNVIFLIGHTYIGCFDDAEQKRTLPYSVSCCCSMPGEQFVR